MTETIRDPSGRQWKAGCLPRTTKVGDGTFKIFDPAKAKSQRRTSIITLDTLKTLVWHIIDQGNQGSCCGCAGVMLVMLMREIMGLKRVILSQASLYGLGNGGSDSGMAIDTCAKLLIKIGACPVDIIGQYDWREFRRDYYPDGHPEGQRYKAIEAYDCPDLETMQAANDLGFPVMYGAKGHAVVRFGLDINSWGVGWKDGGLGVWATDAELRREISRYGAMALRAAIDPVNDFDLPKPAV